MIFNFNNKQHSDAEIVEAYRSGERRLQQWWYDKCRSQFDIGTSRYGGLSDADRDDLFQASFILLWNKMESGQIYTDDDDVTVRVLTMKGDFPVPDLMGYFMRIVKNKYLEKLREGKNMVPLNEVVTADSDEENDPRALFNALYWDTDPEVETERVIGQCLLSLPKSCIEILTLFYYEGKSLEQILSLRQENTSYDGLKTRKSKCMSNLKKRVAEKLNAS